MKERFLEDVKDHEMIIEQDDGVHRSIRFGKGSSSNMYFRINTWPDHLCISGDMGTYVFSRMPDMFEFFRGDELKTNLGYWTEKLKSISCFGSGVKEFDAEGTADNVAFLLEENTLSEEDLQEIRECWEREEAVAILEGRRVLEPWDYIAQKYTFYIQWILYAIRWGIMQYDKKKESIWNS